MKPSDAPRVLIEDRKAQLRFLMDGAVSKAAVQKFVADPQAWNLAPPPPPPSRTNWTRLVPPPVLTGHVPHT